MIRSRAHAQGGLPSTGEVDATRQGQKASAAGDSFGAVSSSDASAALRRGRALRRASGCIETNPVQCLDARERALMLPCGSSTPRLAARAPACRRTSRCRRSRALRWSRTSVQRRSACSITAQQLLRDPIRAAVASRRPNTSYETRGRGTRREPPRARDRIVDLLLDARGREARRAKPSVALVVAQREVDETVSLSATRRRCLR